jgi:acyl-CoA synthetase (AMP-forming)/AMP-acid ligase II
MRLKSIIDIGRSVQLLETILDRLELTEKEYGSRPAVDDGSVCLTYTELVSKARGIGAILSGKISMKEPVAILAEKSTATLSCMYGVVYAGGFYVSVNPEQPPERIRKILEVLESKLVVVDEARSFDTIKLCPALSS